MKTDRMLQHDVLDELAWEPSVDAAHIGVAVAHGVVTLTGTAASFAEKRAAEEAALRVEGVRAVADEIETRLDGASARSDTDLAEAVANVLEWNALVPSGALDVRVVNGYVTLSGSLPWQYQKRQAVNAVAALVGVRGVVDLIRVRPQAGGDDLRAQIERAFERTAREDAARIHVDVHDGEVTLTGTVSSQAELRAAGRTAWSAPGVTRVFNNLTLRVPAYA